MSGIVAWTLKQPDKTASGPVSKGCVHALRGGSKMMRKEECCRLLLMLLKKQETNIYEYLTCIDSGTHSTVLSGRSQATCTKWIHGFYHLV